MTPMRNAVVAGPALRGAHRRVGWYLDMATQAGRLHRRSKIHTANALSIRQPGIKPAKFERISYAQWVEEVDRVNPNIRDVMVPDEYDRILEHYYESKISLSLKRSKGSFASAMKRLRKESSKYWKSSGSQGSQ